MHPELIEDKQLSHLFFPLDEIKVVANIDSASMAYHYVAVYQEEKMLLRVWNDFLSFQQDARSMLITASDPHAIHLKKVSWKYGIDFGVKKPQYFLLMDYPSGGSLFKLLKGEPLPLRARLLIALDMATILNKIEQSGLTYEKLTSSNTLLDNHFRPKLTDFSRRNLAHTHVGELGYVAPEIFCGSSYDPKEITVFSFGVILFNLIRWAETKHFSRNKETLAPLDCPQKLKDLCLECWEEKPEKRPTMAKVESRLKQILSEFDQSADSKSIKTDGPIQREILTLLGEKKGILTNLKTYSPEQEMKVAHFACLHKDPQVLPYLFSVLDNLKGIDINNMLLNCFYQSIINQSLTNVEFLLKRYQTSEYKFNFDQVDLYFDLSLLFTNDKLNTDSPSVDILLLLYKNHLPLFGEPFINFSNLNISESNKVIITKEVAVLQMISFLLNSETLSKENYQDYYYQLISAFNYSIISSHPLYTFKFFQQNISLFKKWNFEKIGSLPIYSQVITDPGYLLVLYNSYSSFKENDLSHLWYGLISPEIALWIDQRKFIQNEETDVLFKFKEQITELLLSLLPDVLVNFILQYFQSSVFDEFASKIDLWTRSVSTNEFKDQGAKNAVYCLPAIKQKLNRSDCGYWSLFNAFKLITELPFSSSAYFKYSPSRPERDSLNNQFKQFKSWVKSHSSSSTEDLTAVTLAHIFDQVTTEKNPDLQHLFPNLQKKLLTWNETAGIPAYTIINSVLEIKDEKSTNHFVFGGNLPTLKMQIAINLYTISQSLDKKQMHFFIIGTEGHWHVQLLATSYYSKGSIYFFRADSGTTSPQIVQQIRAILENLLLNSQNYIENIAEELIPPLYQELKDLTKSKSPKKILNDSADKILEYGKVLVNFFSTFGKLPLAKKYLLTLELFKNKIYSFQQESEDMAKLYQQLDLCYSHLEKTQFSL